VASHPVWPGVVRPHPSRLSGGCRITPSGSRGGSAAPWAKRKFEHLAQRVAEPPPVAQGVVRPPLGPIAQNFFFGRLAQGAARSKFLFWAFGPRGGSAAPWAIGGGSAAPRPADLGVAKPPQAKWGGRPPPMGWFDHLAYFFDFFFLKKKCDGGILGINMLNGLNCHNLKVWKSKMSHLKL
jgi:hypothetical protein